MGNTKIQTYFDEEGKRYQIFIEMKVIGLSLERVELVVTYRSRQGGLLRPNNLDNLEHHHIQGWLLCTRHFCI